MTRLIQTLHAGLLFLLCIFAVYLIILVKDGKALEAQATALLSNANGAVGEQRAAFADILVLTKKYNSSLGPERLNSISRATEKTIGNLAVTSHQLEQASLHEQEYWDRYPAQISDMLVRLNGAIEHTDKSLNEGVLPAATQSMAEMRPIAEATSKAVQDISDELKPVLNNAANLLGDPSITDSIKHIDGAAQNIEGATANVEKTTEVGLEYAKTLTTPSRLAWRVLMGVGQGLSAFGGLLHGVLK